MKLLYHKLTLLSILIFFTREKTGTSHPDGAKCLREDLIRVLGKEVLEGVRRVLERFEDWNQGNCNFL